MLKTRLLKIALLIIAFLITNSFSYDQWVNNLTYNVGDTIEYSSEVWTPARFVYQNTPPPNTWFWIKCVNTSGGTTRAGEIYPQDNYSFIDGIEIITLIPKPTSTYTLSNFRGSLPSGLSINSNTGEISGTPTNIVSPAQSYTITADATPTTGTPYSIAHAIDIRVDNIVFGYDKDVFYFASSNRDIKSIEPTISGDLTAITSFVATPSGATINGNQISVNTTITSTELGYINFTGRGVDNGRYKYDIYINGNLVDSIILEFLGYEFFNSQKVGTATNLGHDLSVGNTDPKVYVFPSLPDGLEVDSITGMITGTPTYAIVPRKYKAYFTSVEIGEYIESSFFLEIENSSPSTGAIKDYYNEGITKIDPKTGEEIKLFGFYNTDQNTKQYVNMKSTYIHASPIVQDDKGIIFSSNFNAALEPSDSIITNHCYYKNREELDSYGKVLKNSNNEFTEIASSFPIVNSIGIPTPKYENDDWVARFNDAVIYYYQEFATGDIYKIHTRYVYNSSDLFFQGYGWIIYPIPNSDLVFAYEYVKPDIDDSTVTDKRDKANVVIIDLSKIKTLKTSRNEFRTLMEVKPMPNPDVNQYWHEYILSNHHEAIGTISVNDERDSILDFFGYMSPANSLDKLGNGGTSAKVAMDGIRTNDLDREIWLTGYVEINYDKSNLSNASADLYIYFRESCYKQDSTDYGVIDGDDDGIGPDEECDCYDIPTSKPSHGYINHTLIHPKDDWILFNDEHAHEEDWRISTSRLHKFVPTMSTAKTLTSQGLGPNSTTTFYHEQGDELITHQSFSSDGKWIYACRPRPHEWSKQISTNRRPGLFRILSDDSSTTEQLYYYADYKGDNSWYAGAHQDHTMDDSLSVIDVKPETPKEDHTPDDWQVVLVSNHSKRSRLLVEYSLNDYVNTKVLPDINTGVDKWDYPTHPFQSHPSFSLTGDYVVFQYINYKLGVNRDIPVVGVVDIKKDPETIGGTLKGGTNRATINRSHVLNHCIPSAF